MIIQSTIFVCDRCDDVAAEAKRIDPFIAPGEQLPTGWAYDKRGDLNCAACAAKYGVDSGQEKK